MLKIKYFTLLIAIIIGMECDFINKGNKEDSKFVEYPRSNKTLIKLNIKHWDEYYKCLNEQHLKIGPNKTLSATSLVAFKETLVILKCQICLSPQNIHKITVKWYFSKINDSNSSTEVYESEHVLISQNGSLCIYKIQINKAGKYWCELGDTISPPYYLHIDNGSELTINVRAEKSKEVTKMQMTNLSAQPPTLIPEYNLKVYSSWTDWSDCSTCDMVGKKIRYGYCTISHLKTPVKRNKNYVPFNDAIFQEAGASKEQLQLLLSKLLNIFRNKIPCRSDNTPLIIQRIPGVAERKSEIMQQYCKKICGRNKLFQVRDKFGNILEQANNSAGIYSFAQKLPASLPSVPRITLYGKSNEKYSLQCPGNLNSDSPFTWKVGDKFLSSKVISEQSSGRIQINSKQEIIFEKLQESDKSIYSCWQNNQLAGSIKLDVSYSIEVKFDNHVVVIGGFVILGTFLKVFWKIFRNR